MADKAYKIARMIESVGVNVEFKFPDIQKMVEDAKKYDFRIVIGPLCTMDYLVEQTKGTNTSVSAPIGTPTGIEETTEMKIFTAKYSIEKGCEDIDMIMNLLYLRSGMEEKVLEEIKKVREAVPNNVLKVVIEAGLLTKEEIKTACELVVAGGADFVKTTTGATGKTTVDIVKTIKEAVGNRVQIKAAGGIQGLAMVEEMISLGVSRFGMNCVNAAAFMEDLTNM